MDTAELINELLKKDNQIIQEVLFMLMVKNKLNFLTLQQSYIHYLETLKEKNLNKIIEAETCVLESLMYDKHPKTEETQTSIQRRLYLLNQDKYFQMDSLNKQFGYNEELAKTYSHSE